MNGTSPLMNLDPWIQQQMMNPAVKGPGRFPSTQEANAYLSGKQPFYTPDGSDIIELSSKPTKRKSNKFIDFMNKVVPNTLLEWGLWIGGSALAIWLTRGKFKPKGK